MKRLLRRRARFVLAPIALMLVLTPLVSGCMKSSAQDIAKPGQTDSVAASGDSTEFTLKTLSDNDGLAFVGVGGDIDGVRNPPLNVGDGDAVKVTLVNDDGAEHTIAFADFGAESSSVIRKGAETSISFTADKAGTFEYHCTLVGHAQAGMTGEFTVGDGGAQVRLPGVESHRRRMPNGCVQAV